MATSAAASPGAGEIGGRGRRPEAVTDHHCLGQFPLLEELHACGDTLCGVRQGGAVAIHRIARLGSGICRDRVL